MPYKPVLLACLTAAALGDANRAWATADHATVRAHWLDEPALNHVWRNVFYRCGRLATGNPANLDLFANGVFEDEDPGFVDATSGDYRLKPNAALFATVGFRPIPVEEIGLYEDEYRATWPVATTPVEVPDWR